MNEPEQAAVTDPRQWLTPDRFRHEYGRLVGLIYGRLTGGRLSVAGLSRTPLTSEPLAMAEDIAQESLIAAMKCWPLSGMPLQPAAWLTRVALNRLADQLRRRGTEASSQAELSGIYPAVVSQTAVGYAGEVTDDTLPLLFACCHPAISADSQLALTLQIVAGFSVGEIARAFVSDERTIAQRIVRAKRQLRAIPERLEIPAGNELAVRGERVLSVLYLLFGEGYLAASCAELTRPELCREAVRLLQLFLEHPVLARQVSLLSAAQALGALMLFQLARLPARQDDAGELLMLEEQDRTRYDRSLIDAAFEMLQLACHGDQLSRYHLEAVILSCHVRAQEMAATDWATILACYDTLLSIAPSPVVRLNRAVALSQHAGPAAGLEELSLMSADPAMQRYHLYHAVRGDLLRRSGQVTEAADCYQRAIGLTQNTREQIFLNKQLARLSA